MVILLANALVSSALAQSQRKYEEHEVIDIGNGIKIEILNFRGEGENEECNVIYYTDKRQTGKRVWEKTSKVKELEHDAKLAEAQIITDLKKSSNVGNSANSNQTFPGEAIRPKAVMKPKTYSVKGRNIITAATEMLLAREFSPYTETSETKQDRIEKPLKKTTITKDSESIKMLSEKKQATNLRPLPDSIKYVAKAITKADAKKEVQPNTGHTIAPVEAKYAGLTVDSKVPLKNSIIKDSAIAKSTIGNAPSKGTISLQNDANAQSKRNSITADTSIKGSENKKATSNTIGYSPDYIQPAKSVMVIANKAKEVQIKKDNTKSADIALASNLVAGNNVSSKKILSTKDSTNAKSNDKKISPINIKSSPDSIKSFQNNTASINAKKQTQLNDVKLITFTDTKRALTWDDTKNPLKKNSTEKDSPTKLLDSKTSANKIELPLDSVKPAISKLAKASKEKEIQIYKNSIKPADITVPNNITTGSNAITKKPVVTTDSAITKPKAKMQLNSTKPLPDSVKVIQNKIAVTSAKKKLLPREVTSATFSYFKRAITPEAVAETSNKTVITRNISVTKSVDKKTISNKIALALSSLKSIKSNVAKSNTFKDSKKSADSIKSSQSLIASTKTNKQIQSNQKNTTPPAELKPGKILEDYTIETLAKKTIVSDSSTAKLNDKKTYAENIKPLSDATKTPQNSILKTNTKNEILLTVNNAHNSSDVNTTAPNVTVKTPLAKGSIIKDSNSANVISKSSPSKSISGARDTIIPAPPAAKITVKKELPFTSKTRSLSANKKRFAFDSTTAIRVAIFAPLYIDDAFMGATYNLDKATLPKNILTGLEFYNGVMMAVDSLSQEGVNAEIMIYDTRQTKNLSEVLASPELLHIGLVIAFITNTSELKQFSQFSLQKNIPLISATYPNTVGIIDNPFFVLLNSSFPVHLEGLYKHMQRFYATDNIIAVRRVGATEDFIKKYITELNKNNRPALNIKWVDLKENFTLVDLTKNLDSTKNNIVFVASTLESFGLKVVKTLNFNPGYRSTAIGMPTWDGVKELNGKECSNVEIVYSTPFVYTSQNMSLSTGLIKKYRDKYYSRPSDMAYKGFETAYHFTKLLSKYQTNLVNNLSDKSFTLFNQFDIQPVKVRKNSLQPDYLENKKLYFIRKQEGNIKSIM